MKKAIGVVIGIVIALGLAFGVREVIANRAEQHPKTEAVAKMDSGSQPKVFSSSTSSSSKPKSSPVPVNHITASPSTRLLIIKQRIGRLR